METVKSQSDDQTAVKKKTRAYQSPVAFSIDFLPSDIYPTATVHEVTEHIDERFLDNNLCPHDRFRIPTEWRQ